MDRPEHEPSLKKYRQGCRCPGCKAANAQAQRDYQAKKKGKSNETPSEIK